jgi:hypothetical protein
MKNPGRGRPKGEKNSSNRKKSEKSKENSIHGCKKGHWSSE